MSTGAMATQCSTMIHSSSYREKFSFFRPLMCSLSCTPSLLSTRYRRGKSLRRNHSDRQALSQRSVCSDLADTPARSVTSLRGRNLIARATAVEQRLPEALLFDCDGVLVDTERDGHRVAFNQTFDEEFGVGKHVWDVDLYGELLKIGGGKERMNHYFSIKESEEPYASLKTEEERKEFLLKMHLRKTAIFMEVWNK